MPTSPQTLPQTAPPGVSPPPASPPVRIRPRRPASVQALPLVPPAELAVGQWVALSCPDGAYRGRVRFADDEWLSVQAGAGMWRVRRRDVVAARLTRPGRFAASPLPERECDAQVRRILSRWP